MSDRLICVFPGQGSQFVGMGRALYEADADVRALYDAANDTLGYDLKQICFEGPEETLRLTQHTQPAILVHSIAVWTQLRRRGGIQPVLMAGHSLGEYSALVAAGALSFTDAVSLVHQRGTFMQQAVPPGEGSMAAMTRAPCEEVEALCIEVGAEKGVLQPANYNSPEQTVIAGHTGLVHEAVAIAKARRLGRPVLLNVSAPFHCALLQPAASQLDAVLSEIAYGELALPVISNVTAEPHPSPQEVRHWLVAQVTSPVRWVDAMQYAVAQGGDTLLEVGPGNVLSGLMRRIDRDVRVLSVDEVLGRL
jgi:[acyl-carrier-protein] S-malonyltransferase